MDVQNPSAEDIVKLTKEFSLHPAVAQELSKPTFRPRAVNYGPLLYLVLHLPLFDSRDEKHRSRELDVVVGKNYLLTIHYDVIEPLTDFFNLCDLNLSLRDLSFNGSTERLFYLLWKKIYEDLLTEVDHIQRKVDRIEERIFSGQEKKLIEDISALRRDILDFSRALRPHDTILESLREHGKSFFGNHFEGYCAELTSRYRRLLMLIDNNKDALETLYDTNDSLLTHRSNEIMKTFTMLALLTFPLTLIATVFAIDAVSRPIIGRPNDFWIVVGILLSTVLVMLVFFKYRRWF